MDDYRIPASAQKSAQIALELNELFGARRPTAWVTRERPKIDRIACPWLIARFVDANARILYAPTEQVFEVAKRRGAVAFDIPGAPFSHVGELCSFDAFLTHFDLLGDAGLAALAPIVRGADTDRHNLAPEAAGLHALSLGLCVNFPDDRALLAQGMIFYDALYAWATRRGGNATIGSRTHDPRLAHSKRRQPIDDLTRGGVGIFLLRPVAHVGDQVKTT